MSDSFVRLKDKLKERYFEVEDVDISSEEPNSNSVSIKDEEMRIESVLDQVVVSCEPTKISFGTEIQGHVNVTGDLNVNGNVIGDIVSQGHIVIDGGDIAGNIQAKSIVLMNATVKGHILSETSVTIYENCQLNGNVTGDNVTIESKCKGNITASDSLFLKAGAIIKGDICTIRLKIDDGAGVDGQIKMNKK